MGLQTRRPRLSDTRLWLFGLGYFCLGYAHSQKETLKNSDEFFAKVTEFQTDCEVKAEGAEKFEENKSKWNQMVTDIFDKGGLNSVMKLVGLQNSAPVSSFVSAALAPVFYMIFVH
ncbi:hypothetical protein L3Y34_003475 [Caenorhabditis briggsae]|uniref:Uncharacterized protein n=1 Tax=Caenorhabditis briggsae TaxID=6238 RepID=A0AAE9AB07_CAEBR|nr:hypothetical protein L3Y34_003475 [Caenorhabditis briggsae]